MDRLDEYSREDQLTPTDGLETSKLGPGNQFPTLGEANADLESHDEMVQGETPRSDRPSEGKRNGTVVAVAGAKGGVGRTVVALNLAVALERAGAWVIMVDFDLEFGDVALALDLVPDRTVADIPGLTADLSPALLGQHLTRHSSGLRVLPAPLEPGHGSHFGHSHVGGLLSVLKGMFDYIVLDLPRGIDPVSMAAIEAADRVLVVTDPQLASLKNTRLAIAAMSSRNVNLDRVWLILNNPSPTGQTARAEVEAATSRDVAIEFPYEKDLGRAWLQGKTIFDLKPRSRFAARIRECALRMIPPEPRPRSGSRILPWLRRVGSSDRKHVESAPVSNGRHVDG